MLGLLATRGWCCVTGEPDLVVTGARVWTPGGLDGAPADGIAIRGDRVVAIGAADDVRRLAGPRSRVIEAPGRLVVPGFQDGHVHTPFAGRNLMNVWLNDLAGRPAYLAAIAAFAAHHPELPWIIGGGWAMEHFPGGTPRKEDLDRVVPDRPVFLFNRDVHGAWVNSRTLELAEISADTPDPADGRIERDAVTGEPSGTLHEGAAYRVNDTLVPVPDVDGWRAAILRGQGHLHRLGITGWQDAWVTPATLAAYRGLAADGRLTGRVVGALWWDRHRGLEQIPELQAQREAASDAAAAAGSGVPGFFPTTVKIMVDGVLENHTGALLEPYCDGCGGSTDNHGITFVERELLSAAVTELDGLGFQVHMHAIGDRAVRNALDAIATARAAHGMNDLRHHVAHIQVVHPDDVPRFAALGAVANCQAYWAQSEQQMDELTIPFLGAARATQQYPFGSIARAGGRLAMGSDWAVTTANPLEQIEVAVNRIDPEQRSREPFLPAERLSLTQALTAFTAGSAYVNHDPDGGRLAVGGRADLAVLSDDVFRPDFGSSRSAPLGDCLPLGDVRVELTVAAGRIVHAVEDGAVR
jgi:predicted amidohydrolase YtcJ